MIGEMSFNGVHLKLWILIHSSAIEITLKCGNMFFFQNKNAMRLSTHIYLELRMCHLKLLLVQKKL